MIIKKSMLNIHKKWRGTWPFTVDEVAVIKIEFQQLKCYAVIHQYKPYALSGALENSFEKLENAGIWAKNPAGKSSFGDYPSKKSLSPFFEFLDWQSGGMG